MRCKFGRNINLKLQQYLNFWTQMPAGITNSRISVEKTFRHVRNSIRFSFLLIVWSGDKTLFVLSELCERVSLDKSKSEITSQIKKQKNVNNQEIPTL